eukprot:scaffold103897_cov39-Phaeocystis_antarctica.AAC.1
MWADTQGPSLSSHEQRMAGIKVSTLGLGVRGLGLEGPTLHWPFSRPTPPPSPPSPPVSATAKNNYTGHVASYEPASEFAFEEQYHTFNAHGYAMNPNTGSDARQSDAQGPGQAPQLPP